MDSLVDAFLSHNAHNGILWFFGGNVIPSLEPQTQILCINQLIGLLERPELGYQSRSLSTLSAIPASTLRPFSNQLLNYCMNAVTVEQKDIDVHCLLLLTGISEQDAFGVCDPWRYGLLAGRFEVPFSLRKRWPLSLSKPLSFCWDKKTVAELLRTYLDSEYASIVLEAYAKLKLVPFIQEDLVNRLKHEMLRPWSQISWSLEAELLDTILSANQSQNSLVELLSVFEKVKRVLGNARYKEWPITPHNGGQKFLVSYSRLLSKIYPFDRDLGSKIISDISFYIIGKGGFEELECSLASIYHKYDYN